MTVGIEVSSYAAMVCRAVLFVELFEDGLICGISNMSQKLEVFQTQRESETRHEYHYWYEIYLKDGMNPLTPNEDAVT